MAMMAFPSSLRYALLVITIYFVIDFSFMWMLPSEAARTPSLASTPDHRRICRNCLCSAPPPRPGTCCPCVNATSCPISAKYELLQNSGATICPLCVCSAPPPKPGTCCPCFSGTTPDLISAKTQLVQSSGLAEICPACVCSAPPPKPGTCCACYRGTVLSRLATQDESP